MSIPSHLPHAVGGRSSAPAYKRVMMFVDNSGADIVLGMLPLARELLKMGSEVRREQLLVPPHVLHGRGCLRHRMCCIAEAAAAVLRALV